MTDRFRPLVFGELFSRGTLAYESSLGAKTFDPPLSEQFWFCARIVRIAGEVDAGGTDIDDENCICHGI